MFYQKTWDEHEEIEVPVQKDRAKWAIHKSWKDSREAMGLFHAVTEKFGEIASAMSWVETEPQNVEEGELARKYKIFFTEDWDSYKPKFLKLPQDFYADY